MEKQKYWRINIAKWPEAWSSANYGMDDIEYRAIHGVEFKDRLTKNYWKQEFPAVLDRMYQELLDKSDMVYVKGGSADEMVEFMEEEIAADMIKMIYRVGKSLGLTEYR